MDNVLQEYGSSTFELKLPPRWWRLAWAGGMAGLGLLTAWLGFPETSILPILAMLSGVSSNWSG